MLSLLPTTFKSPLAVSHCSYQKDKLKTAIQWIISTSSQTHLFSHPVPSPSTSPATGACFLSFKPVMTHSSSGLCTGWKAISLLHFTELTLNHPSDATFPEKSLMTLKSQVLSFYYKLQNHVFLLLFSPSSSLHLLL